MSEAPAPQPGFDYPLLVGNSFLRKRPRHSFCSLRYDFKAQSAGDFQPGKLHHQPSNNKVSVQLPNNQTGQNDLEYQGVYLPSKDDLDCVAIFDGTAFRIELLSGAVKSKRVREVTDLKDGFFEPEGGDSFDEELEGYVLQPHKAPPPAAARASTAAAAGPSATVPAVENATSDLEALASQFLQDPPEVPALGPPIATAAQQSPQPQQQQQRQQQPPSAAAPANGSGVAAAVAAIQAAAPPGVGSQGSPPDAAAAAGGKAVSSSGSDSSSSSGSSSSDTTSSDDDDGAAAAAAGAPLPAAAAAPVGGALPQAASLDDWHMDFLSQPAEVAAGPDANAAGNDDDAGDGSSGSSSSSSSSDDSDAEDLHKCSDDDSDGVGIEQF